MTAKLFSISALATELDRDRRTIGKALARVSPDGKTASGDAAWHLTTALAALDRNEGRRGGHGGDDDADIREVEFVARKLHDFFAKLRAEPSIEKRRKMVDDGEGAVVGEFVRAVERSQGQSSPAIANVAAPYVDRMVGAVISELFSLCHLELDTSK